MAGTGPFRVKLELDKEILAEQTSGKDEAAN
jgi:hypothetical protein